MTAPRYGAKTLWRPVSMSAATSPAADRLWPGQVFKGTAKAIAARRNVVSLFRQARNKGERGTAAHRRKRTSCKSALTGNEIYVFQEVQRQKHRTAGTPPPPSEPSSDVDDPPTDSVDSLSPRVDNSAAINQSSINETVMKAFSDPGVLQTLVSAIRSSSSASSDSGPGATPESVAAVGRLIPSPVCIS